MATDSEYRRYSTAELRDMPDTARFTTRERIPSIAIYRAHWHAEWYEVRRGKFGKMQIRYWAHAGKIVSNCQLSRRKLRRIA